MKGITVKTPLRFQSQLLLRRSYKPARIRRRTLGITFQPTRPIVVSISNNEINDKPASTTSGEVTLSG